jgi:hypothetical protein
MPKRPITALVAALALLAAVPAASHAQEPPADASREVKAIYDDFGNDGKLDVCDHTRANLQEALDTIEPSFHTDFPDFREALEAGIQDHEKGRCGADATPTATATATASPQATATPESGDLPQHDGGGDDGTGAVPPEDGSLPPEFGDTAPQPEAATPAPTAAAPTPAPPAAAVPTASPTPVIVTRSNTDGLLLPGILLGIALLGATALAAFAIASRRSERFNHVWREAAFRTRGTWADFSDWLKLGR